MKKIISLTLISSVAVMLITGCGSSESSSHDAGISENALYVNTHNNEKLAHAIHKAGKNTGWKITAYKSNMVIAEKSDGDTTHSLTLKFNDGHVEFENAEGTSDGDIDDLRDAIEDIANEKDSH